MRERALNPVSKRNNRVMFGREEKDWREYTRVRWSAEKCPHIGFLPTFFMVKSEVWGTGSGLASIQYLAIVAGSSKFANMV